MAGVAAWVSGAELFEGLPGLPWRADKRAKANGSRASKAPNPTKQHQTQNHITGIEMPFNGVECHELTEPPGPANAECKNPMPQSSDRVPDFLALKALQVGLLLMVMLCLIFIMAGFTRLPDRTDLRP